MSLTLASISALQGCCPCGDISRSGWTAGSPPPETGVAKTMTGAALPKGGRPRASARPCQSQAAEAGSRDGAFRAAERSARTNTRVSPAGTSGACLRPSRSAFLTVAEMTTGLASARSARSVHESGPDAAAGAPPSETAARHEAAAKARAMDLISAKATTTSKPTRKTVAAGSGAPYQTASGFDCNVVCPDRRASPGPSMQLSAAVRPECGIIEVAARRGQPVRGHVRFG